MKVSLIAAMTADGFIAQQVDQVSTAWTSAEDKAWFSEFTKKVGVMIMGSATFRTINRALKGRRIIVYTRQPELLQGFSSDDVMATQLSPHELVQQLEQEKYSEIAICGGSSIYSMWIESGLVTDVYLTIEPVFFGQGINLFSKPHLQRMHLVDTEMLNDSTQLLHFTMIPISVVA